MSPFADMPTHAMNDLNVALWIVFFIGFAAFSLALGHVNRRPRRKVR